MHSFLIWFIFLIETHLDVSIFDQQDEWDQMDLTELMVEVSFRGMLEALTLEAEQSTILHSSNIIDVKLW